MRKCNVCEKTWFIEDSDKCPRCGESDYTELNQLNTIDRHGYNPYNA